MATSKTKNRILDAAENLFARDGFDATSLRNVTAEGGVNIAAVNYHFGSKENLIEAVFARRLTPVNDERLRLLAERQKAADSEPLQVEEIMAMFIGPIFRLAAQSPDTSAAFMQLIGRLHAESDHHLREIVYRQFTRVVERYIAALEAALPHLDADELYARFHCAIGAMAAALAAPQRLSTLSQGRVQGEYSATSFKQLIAFVSAGFQAPATAACETIDAAMDSRTDKESATSDLAGADR